MLLRLLTVSLTLASSPRPDEARSSTHGLPVAYNDQRLKIRSQGSFGRLRERAPWSMVLKSKLDGFSFHAHDYIELLGWMFKDRA